MNLLTLLLHMCQMAGLPGPVLEHSWCCESCLWKVEWIRDNFPDCKRIFLDAADLATKMFVWDALSNQEQEVEPVDWLTFGFVCSALRH